MCQPLGDGRGTSSLRGRSMVPRPHFFQTTDLTRRVPVNCFVSLQSAPLPQGGSLYIHTSQFQRPAPPPLDPLDVFHIRIGCVFTGAGPPTKPRDTSKLAKLLSQDSPSSRRPFLPSLSMVLTLAFPLLRWADDGRPEGGASSGGLGSRVLQGFRRGIMDYLCWCR